MGTNRYGLERVESENGDKYEYADSHRQGDVPEAAKQEPMKESEEASAIMKPVEVEAMLKEAITYVQQGRESSKAEAMLRRVRVQFAVSGESYSTQMQVQAAMVHGYACAQLDKQLEAAEAFKVVINALPTHENANAQLGQALLGSGKILEAVREMRRAVESLPNGPVVRMALSLALTASLDEPGHLNEACRHLSRAVTLGNPEVKYPNPNLNSWNPALSTNPNHRQNMRFDSVKSSNAASKRRLNSRLVSPQARLYYCLGKSIGSPTLVLRTFIENM